MKNQKQELINEVLTGLLVAAAFAVVYLVWGSTYLGIRIATAQAR